MGNQKDTGHKLNFGFCGLCKQGLLPLCVNGLCSFCCGSTHFKEVVTYYIKEKSYDGNDDFVKKEWVEFHNPQIITDE